MAESPSKLLPPPPTPMPTPGIQAPPATERRPRRPRAREVSSRYLSPSSSSSSSSSSSEHQHLAASPRNAYPAPSPLSRKHHQQPQPWSRPFSSDPEGVKENRAPAAARHSSSQTPLVLNPATSKPPVTIKKRTVVRLFADNNATSSSLEDPADPRRRPRPGTPVVPHPAEDFFGGGVKVHPRPPTPVRVSLFPFEKGKYGRGSGDNRLDETSSENSFSDSEICSVSSRGGLCDSPPLLPPVSCRLRPVEVRSSMPEVDFLPTMSARRAAEACSGQQEATDDSSCRASTNSLCLRSLNSAIAGRQQQHAFNLSKSVSRPLFSVKPPQPPTTTKSVTDMKKGRKASTRQEEVHLLRLLDNHLLQWRFINAKAQAAAEARTIAAEKSLVGLSERTLELRSSVGAKRIELEQLKRREALSSIIQSQTPHLEEWSILEDDYSSSLSGVTKALQNASLRLPVIGNVRVDIKEMEKVLDSTIHVLESSSSHAAKLLPKAEEIKVVASDLASTISMQKSLTEECGNLLSESHRLQVTECSLRSLIMQKKKCQM